MSDTPVSYRDDPEFLPWLKGQPGFSDLFAAPTGTAAADPAPTSGGGENVPANQMQERASDLVKAITEAAITAGRKGDAPGTAAPAPPPTKPQSAISKFLFGEDK